MVRENDRVVNVARQGEHPLPTRPAGSPFSLSALSCPASLRCYHEIVQTKQQIGEGIWRSLQRRGIAGFASAVGRIPNSDAPETGLIEGVRIIPVSSLAQLAAHLSGAQTIPKFQRPAQPPVAEHVWDGHGHADDDRVTRR